MIIVEVKDPKDIDKALKQYKRKHDKIGVAKELRKRQAFVKKSEARRAEIKKAAYVEQKYKKED